MEGLLLLLAVIAVVFYLQRQKARKQLDEAQAKAAAAMASREQEWQQLHEAQQADLAQARLDQAELEERIAALRQEVASLARFQNVRDADAMLQQMEHTMAELKATTEQAVTAMRRQAE